MTNCHLFPQREKFPDMKKLPGLWRYGENCGIMNSGKGLRRLKPPEEGVAWA